jgi:SPP1 family predicted phage head-tail adaptor
MGKNLKDKKICIWRFDADETEQYEKIHDGKLWAYYRQTSAEEFFRAMTNQYTEEAIFVINWRNDIIPRTDVILFNHKVYDINRVDDFEGYKKEIRISAKFNQKQSLKAFPGLIDN